MNKRKRDKYGRLEFNHIILAKPGKRLYTVLNSVDESTVSLTKKCNNLSTLSFEIDRYVDINGEFIESNAYKHVDELMELYCDDMWFVISQPPRIVFDGWKERKIIEAESYEVRLQQFVLNNFYINMGREDSQEMIYGSEHDPSKFYQIKFYDERNPKLSLLHLVLSHANVKGWTIGYVDNITLNETDNSTLLPDEVSYFEVDSCSVYSFLTQQVSEAFSCIFVFDTMNMTINAFRAESLGNNTNLVLSYRNVQNSLTKTRENPIVTAFKVGGADGINIDYVNFGTNIIFDYSFLMCEPYMSAKLVAKMKAWIAYREEQRPIYIELTKKYNKNLEVLSELEYRVPVDTAQNDWFAVKEEDLKIAYSDNVAEVRGLEALYVDKNNQFDLEALKKSHDWPLYESIMNYTLPAIVAALQAKGSNVDGYGTGNVINNVNPVTLDKDWLTIGADKATITPEQVDDSPAYGITRGLKVKLTGSGTAGVLQRSITVEESQNYVLSCYVKGSGTFNLGFGKNGEEMSRAYSITSSWTRVFAPFNTPSKLINVSFTGDADFEICGMQLEMGANPSQFGFFIQKENVIRAWETDWKLYGIKELETKISVYENSIQTLKESGYSIPYSALSQFSEDYHTQMYQKYKDLLKLLDEAKAALAERTAEHEAAGLPEIQKRLEEIARNVEIQNFGKKGVYEVEMSVSSDGVLSFTDFATPKVDSNGTLVFPDGIEANVDADGILSVEANFEPFTEKEIFIINSLYNEQEYTNENILITTLDDLSDAVDKQKVLYDDAVDRLYVESHHQYSYENDVDSLYALPEFADFDDDLEVGNFLRIENEDGKFVKLRCTEITYNPCAWDETMELVFSDMVQYKSKYSDVASLIADVESSSSKRQIVGGNGGNSVTDYVFSTEAIKKLFSNPFFQSMMGGTTVGGAGSGGNIGGPGGGTITADVIITKLIEADEAIIGKLTADTIFAKYLNAELINAETIITKVIEADKAKIEELAATIINAHEINADLAKIRDLLAGGIGTDYLDAIHITADNAVIDEAVIIDLIVKKLSVADLIAHNASAERLDIITTDGNPAISFLGATQQFYDKDGNVRVQIGQDGNGDFTFVLMGADGKGILLNQDGIQKDGIPDNTIVNGMISDKAVTPNKVTWNVEVDEDGNQITYIETVYMGDGRKFGEELVEIKENIDGSYKAVEQVQSTVDGLNLVIENKISKDEIETILDDSEVITIMRTNISEQKQTLEGWTSKVGEMETHLGGINKSIERHETTINQTSTTLSLIASGDSESSFTLTEHFLSLVSDEVIGIIAPEINIDGVVSFMNSAMNGDKTVINAGSIDTKTVNAMLIKTKFIQSHNYEEFKPINDEYFSKSGLQINMETGEVRSVNFNIDSEGNARFKGSGSFDGKITASSGWIGGEQGFIIESGHLYSGMTSFNDEVHDGVYIGWEGIALGKGNFSVDNKGRLVAKDGVFSGSIEAGSTVSGAEIIGGTITGGNIIGVEFNNGNGTFHVDRYGNLTATNATIKGTVYATSGKFEGDVYANNGVFNGIVYATDGEFTGVINALAGGKIGGFTITENSLEGAGVSINPTELKYGEVFKVTEHTGELAGFKFTNVDDLAEHKYRQTLYRIVRASDGYDYQSGLKGNSSTNGNTEATFYVRKKPSNESSWENSTLPFYVRNNGYTYCENMTVGNTLYMNITSFTPTDENQVSHTSVLDGYGGILSCGLIDEGDYISMGGSFDFNLSGRSILSLEQDFNNTDIYYLKPTWNNYKLNLGKKDTPFRHLYVEQIDFADSTSMTTAPKSGSGTTTDYDALNNKPLINNTVLSGSLSLATLGIAARTHSHNNYLPATLNSKGNYELNANTIQIPNMKGYNVSDYNGSIVTGIYMDDDGTSVVANNRFIIGAVNHPTVLRGTELRVWDSDLGKNTDGTYNYVTLADYISSHSNSSGGTTNYNDLSNKPRIYNGSSYTTLSGDVSLSTLGIYSKSEVQSSFADTLYISGNTLTLRSWNGRDLSSVDLPSSGGSVSGNYISSDSNTTLKTSLIYIYSNNDSTNFNLGMGYSSGKAFVSSKAIYNDTNSSAANMFINTSGTIKRSTASSRRYKHDIKNVDFSKIEKLYKLPVRAYKYNDDYLSEDDRRYGKDVIGLIAEEVYDILPDIVDFNENNEIEVWNSKMIIPCLLALIQNNKKEIDTLKQEAISRNNTVMQLEGEVAIMKQKLEEHGIC